MDGYIVNIYFLFYDCMFHQNFSNHFNNLKSTLWLSIFTLMLNSLYFVKKSIPRRLTFLKAWVGFTSNGLGFDRWIWTSFPPIWYNYLGNFTSVEYGLWEIAHRARWVKVVWGDFVSIRKWILTNLFNWGCEVGIETNSRWAFPMIAPLY